MKKILLFNTAYYFDNEMIMTGYDINIIIRYDIREQKIISINTIPDETMVLGGRCSNIFRWNNYYIFVLQDTAKVWMLDVDNDSWSHIIVDQRDDMPLMIRIAFLNGDKLFVAGQMQEILVCVDLNSRIVKDIANNYSKKSNSVYRFGDTYIENDKYIYLPCMYRAEIMRIDMSNMESRFISIGDGDSMGYRGIYKFDDRVFLLPRDGGYVQEISIENYQDSIDAKNIVKCHQNPVGLLYDEEMNILYSNNDCSKETYLFSKMIDGNVIRQNSDGLILFRKSNSKLDREFTVYFDVDEYLSEHMSEVDMRKVIRESKDFDLNSMIRIVNSI